MIPALFRVFNEERIPDIDLSKPENLPLAKAQSALRNQAYVDWYNGPGRYAVDELEKALIGKIIAAIKHPRYTTPDRNKNLALLDEINRDAKLIDTIVFSFEEEKKRKSEGL